MRFVTPPPPLARWQPALFPPALASCRARLSERLLERIGPDGALRDPCRSRVLESALTLALLDLIGHAHRFGAVRDRLVRYLRRQRHLSDAWDEAFTATVLGRHRGSAVHQRMAEEFVARTPAFTGWRKRLLAKSLFVMLGGPAPAVAAEDLAGELLHPWAAVQVAAARTVLAHGAGRSDLVRDQDISLLLSTQQPGQLGRVWEGNVLIHLMVLHALARLPGHEPAVARGVSTVLRQQRDDGGIPFVTDTDTWCTVVAGLALHTAGAPSQTLRPVAAHLMSLQRPDGGWSYTDRAKLADTDCTAVAVELLHRLDPVASRTAIGRALRYLLSVRGRDGGFPTYGAKTPSEPCMTAAAINALTTQAAAHERVIDGAVAFLASCQHSDGSFPAGWSGSRLHALFRAHLATRGLVGPAQAVNERIVGLVRRSQNDDGGWGQQGGDGSDAISTAYGLIVAAGGFHDHRPAARAVRYLISQQGSDGGFDAPPDMLGPRPLPYHVPLLTDAFVLLAMGHLAQRTATASRTVPGRRRPPMPVERTP
ncbi:prenyltransferase/squalene oxidase repeat-containing protein [Streptomyces lavendofoliae]|uniref:prenyltransferase/squalene oxidase repeat-containing protein n=1 Tax=Streptomyces lavendofoliae TaxID=67314 RepID=UPI003D93C528